MWQAASDPAAAASAPRSGQGPLPAQVRALLEAARGRRSEALYAVAVHTGLRQGEPLGLKWTDVDLDAGKLSVHRSLKITENGLGFGPPKNKASRRGVPLNKTAVGGPQRVVAQVSLRWGQG
jgi:integrase